MVERGARNLLLLSRSGKNSDTARQLVAELESQGVSVLTPKCDVSNTVQLKRLLQNAAENMPPIKGCIQATVALRVSCLPSPREPLRKADKIPRTNRLRK